MSKRYIVLVVGAAAVAMTCVRLGFWQLDRLRERRARNAEAAARLAYAPAVPEQLPSDPAIARFRRVVARGTYDFERELVLGARTREGSPGVHLVTPLRLESGDAVLVNRGWVYSPDARRVDLSRWREPERATVAGYVQTFETDSRPARAATDARLWWRLDEETLRTALPYALRRYYIVAVPESGTARRTAPAPLGMPSLSEGPHRGYAVQWFAFATIAVAGVALLIRRDRSRRVGPVS